MLEAMIKTFLWAAVAWLVLAAVRETTREVAHEEATKVCSCVDSLIKADLPEPLVLDAPDMASTAWPMIEGFAPSTGAYVDTWGGLHVLIEGVDTLVLPPTEVH